MPFIGALVIDFEPELDRVLAGPFLESRRPKADRALVRIQISRHVPIVAGNAIENRCFICKCPRHQCSTSASTDTLLRCWHLKEDVFKVSLTGKLDLTLKAPVRRKCLIRFDEVVPGEAHIDQGVFVFHLVAEVYSLVRIQLPVALSQVEVLNEAIERTEEAQLARRPLLLHVLLDFAPEESVTVLISDY